MLEMEMKIQQKTYPEGRRCKTCGKPLSIYNSERYCFRHSPVLLRDITPQERVFLREEFPPLPEDQFPTVCTSRSTPGFDQAQIDYYGSKEK